MRFLPALALLPAVALALPPSYLGQQFPLSVQSQSVDSESLQEAITAKNLLKRATDLYAAAAFSTDDWGHPTRLIGSKGHNKTVEYILSTLRSLGSYYTVSTQDFPAFLYQISDSQLSIDGAVLASAVPIRRTPSTPDRRPITAPLVLVANAGCDPADFPSNVTGAVALMKRDHCSLALKSLNAGLAGAVAAVIYNGQQEPVGGTLWPPSPEHVPTLGLASSDAEVYVDRLRAGEKLEATVHVDAVLQTIMTPNIIAQTVGGDPDNCVMLGGHSDSVGTGPGINDDGSGSMSLLEVAVQLSRFSVKNCVRFAWWSAEEEGLVGSNYYVSQLNETEKMKIRLFMDYDMLASPNYALQVYNATNAVNPVGSQELRDLYLDWYAEQGLNSTLIEFDGRSDYVAFIQNGIPGGGIATGAEVIKTKEEVDMFGGKAGEAFDVCYHQLCDDVTNLDFDAWLLNTKLVAHSVATYASSFAGFPERVSSGNEFRSTTDHMPYRGSELVI